MRSTIVLVMTVLLCGLTASGLSAATLRWEYTVNGIIVQICADGKGGVAFVDGNAFPNGTLHWLDKKGQQIHQLSLSNVMAGGVLRCSPKELLFIDENPGMVVYQLRAGGTPTPVPAAANTFNIAQKMSPSLLDLPYDTKGFFAQKTNASSATVTLQRYTYK
jgi:hypothetical protein